MPVTNTNSILRLSQLSRFYFNFSNFLQDFTHIFFVFYQNCRKFYQYNHATKEKHRTFLVQSFCFYWPMVEQNSLKNENWPLFGGRWMNLKTESIFKLSKRNGIMQESVRDKDTSLLEVPISSHVWTKRSWNPTPPLSWWC